MDAQKKPDMHPKIPTALTKARRSVFFGAAAFSLGIALLLFKTWLLEYISVSLFLLQPNTMLEEVWRKSPIEIPTNVYFFNWTNPEDFKNLSIKPKFQEVGPYRYMQNMEKVNLVWNDNDTVTFNQIRSWHLDKAQPNGNISDRITTLNAISMVSVHYFRHWNYFIKKAISVVLSTISPQVHITRTVNQFLFEGYDDHIVDLANYLPFIASEVPRFDKFGWFLVRNGSADFDGVFNMATGTNGDFDLKSWNYFNQTPYFEGFCGKVHGSTGELYPRKQSRDHVGIFISDLCRYLLLDYEADVVVHGILGYKYSIGDGTLDNGTLIPENKCYCAGECLPSGLINASSCRYGLPTYGSLPNFYRADQVYLDAVEGLKPNKSKHEAYVILEPNTGALLKASVKLQLNILIQPIPDIEIYEDVPKIFFPLLWAEQEAELPSDMVLILKLYLNAPHILTGIPVLLIVIGVYVLVFIAYKPWLFSIIKKFHEQKKYQNVNTDDVILEVNTEMLSLTKEQCT